MGSGLGRFPLVRPRGVRRAQCPQAAPAWAAYVCIHYAVPLAGGVDGGQWAARRALATARGCDAETCFIKQDWSAEPSLHARKRKMLLSPRQPRSEALYLGAPVGRPFPASVHQRNPLALLGH